MSVRFIALSGTTNVTENLYIYEYLADNKNVSDMLIVDCGVGFPDLEMLGVDLVIPDFSYILENKDKLRAILVSQGHEDHHGALPFLLEDITAPIYAPKLTAAFIESKLHDYEIKKYDIRVYDPNKDSLTIGPFQVHAFRVPHSIPETLGFAIETPEGQLFHVAEHKFDPRPVGGVTFDVERAQHFASRGVLALASDCLGSNRLGFTPSEQEIEARIEKIIREAKNTVFFTTISSNISRMQQVINAATRTNRKVAFLGRSIDQKAQIAHELGFLKYADNLVIGTKEAKNFPSSSLIYIVAGSYGQVGSSLFRLATGEHSLVSAEAGDVIIFSSDPGPAYSKESIDFVVDSFMDLGLEVHYYDLGEGLYVSGHGSQEDIKKLFGIVKPKYFIPVGGTIRFMHGYKKLVKETGSDESRVFMLKAGEIVEFANGQAFKKGKIHTRQVLVDGLGIGDVGRIILKDRKEMAEHGVAVVILKLDASQKKLTQDPEILSRGFVFEKKRKDFLKKEAQALRKRLERTKKLDSRVARYLTVEFLAQRFFAETGRRPLIIPVVVEA